MINIFARIRSINGNLTGHSAIANQFLSLAFFFCVLIKGPRFFRIYNLLSSSVLLLYVLASPLFSTIMTQTINAVDGYKYLKSRRTAVLAYPFNGGQVLLQDNTSLSRTPSPRLTF